MIDGKMYYVSREKWKDEVAARHGYPPNLLTYSPEERKAWADAHLAWNLRTSGSGHLYLTLLYALRAHKRGKVHCHDMTFEEQAEWLTKALPVLRHLMSKDLVERPEYDSALTQRAQLPDGLGRRHRAAEGRVMKLSSAQKYVLTTLHRENWGCPGCEDFTKRTADVLLRKGLVQWIRGSSAVVLTKEGKEVAWALIQEENQRELERQEKEGPL